MINEEAIKSYLLKKFNDIVGVDISKLGVRGAGFGVPCRDEDRSGE